MGIYSWFKRLSRRRQSDVDMPLREFIYLDEVSLRSLLSSQKEGVTDTTSKQTVDSNAVDSSSLAEISNLALGKAQTSSRFQTTNSSTLQTSRKATVQSWFRELHDLKHLRLISEQIYGEPFVRPGQLNERAAAALSLRADRLTRGSLIEMRVKLAADPVFKLGTILSEFTGIASDLPEQYSAQVAEPLRQIEPVYKVLNRLLAGLIPIRASAVDHVVVEFGGDEYVVPRRLVEHLNLPQKPLEIVGVTEHLAYWKDIRRVLFSDADFTILCRVSRHGLHNSWTPVKLTDLFADVVPDLADQMNAASQFAYGQQAKTTVQPIVRNSLAMALQIYRGLMLEDSSKRLTPEQHAMFLQFEEELSRESSAPIDQRNAFAEVGEKVRRIARIRRNSKKDLELRNRAREISGLHYLHSGNAPSQPRETTETNYQISVDKYETSKLIDVEVIAIYW